LNQSWVATGTLGWIGKPGIGTFGSNESELAVASAHTKSMRCIDDARQE
jgi:hypothetical protein